MSKNKNKNKPAVPRDPNSTEPELDELEEGDSDESLSPDEESFVDENDPGLPQVATDGEAAGIPLVSVDEEPEEYEPIGVTRTQFQSPEAERRQRERMAAKTADDSALEGKVVVAKPRAKILADQAKYNELVTVRPVKTEQRFCIGKDEWYNIVAGRKMRVPRHVALLLEEKGYLGVGGF